MIMLSQDLVFEKKNIYLYIYIPPSTRKLDFLTRFLKGKSKVEYITFILKHFATYYIRLKTLVIYLNEYSSKLSYYANDKPFLS